MKKKGGKVKTVYGVNNQKFYIRPNNKTDAAYETLKLAGQVDSFEDREKLFSSNRAVLMKLIRDSCKSISKTCPGLFRDSGHIKEHFYYLTEVNIHKKVLKNLAGHLENMEVYLVSMNDSLELSEKIGKINDDCTLEFSGCKVHKYIQLLRMAGEHFDKEGAALMRIQSDGPPKNSSPHILAVRVGAHYHFELWVEKERLLENMELEESISAFLHLVFCYNLTYPKEAETICDWLQRVVAEYGNDEGTKTNKSKVTAQSKLTRYHIQLGKALGAKNLK